jgi:hypothetical protein
MSEIQTTENQSPSLAPFAVAAGVAAAGLLMAHPARAASPALTFDQVPGSGDVKILNYALLLERLETELYVQAVQRLSTGGNGGRDAVPGLNIQPIGGVSTSTSPTGAGVDLLYYKRFGRVEQEHRDFLEGALGAAAIPVGAFKFDFGINNLSRRELLDLVIGAEEVGVTAYLGALPLISAPKTAQTAAAIEGTEARHASAITLANNILVSNGTLGGQVRDVAPLARNNAGRDSTRTPQQVLALPVVQNAIVRA